MRKHQTILIAIIAALTAVLASSPAGAAPKNLSPSNTPTPCGATQLFAASGDSAYYTKMSVFSARLVPTTTTGAVIVTGSSVAFTGSCTSYIQPQVRLIAANSGNPAATLTLSVQYKDRNNVWQNVAIGTLTGTGTLQPSPIYTFDASQIKGNLQLTLTPNGTGGNWNIAGAYLDPRRGV